MSEAGRGGRRIVPTVLTYEEPRLLLWRTELGHPRRKDLVSKNNVLRKIDRVMIRVEDVKAAASYYTDVFGLCPKWSDESSIGLGFQESDAEIVLHCDSKIPSSV